MFSQLFLNHGGAQTQTSMPVFRQARITEHEIDILASFVTEMCVRKGHVFFSEGQTNFEQAVYLIHHGKVSLSTSSKGEKRFLGSDEFFGHDTVWNKGNHPTAAPHTIVAEDHTTVGCLTLASIESALGEGRLSKGNVIASIRDRLDTSLTADVLKRDRMIGEGAFGQVWVVSRKGTEEVYALKVQNKRDLVKHKQVDGLMREKNVMASLDHPFIIKLLNVYQDALYVYMVLRFVQGGELYGAVHRDGQSGLPEQHAAFYAANIHEGLSYMHRRDIVYR